MGVVHGNIFIDLNTKSGLRKQINYYINVMSAMVCGVLPQEEVLT